MPSVHALSQEQSQKRDGGIDGRREGCLKAGGRAVNARQRPACQVVPVREHEWCLHSPHRVNGCAPCVQRMEPAVRVVAAQRPARMFMTSLSNAKNSDAAPC